MELGPAAVRAGRPCWTSGRAALRCRFTFKPGTYDQDFHRPDAQIDQFARSPR
jgi:hypothetical protein